MRREMPMKQQEKMITAWFDQLLEEEEEKGVEEEGVAEEEEVAEKMTEVALSGAVIVSWMEWIWDRNGIKE